MTPPRRLAALGLAFLAASAAQAAPLPDGDYRCDASSDTTAQFVHVVVRDGALAEFDLAAVNRLRADVCQIGLSHHEAKVRAQKAGWQLTFEDEDGAPPCRVTLSRQGGALSIGVAGAGCSAFCGTRTSFWPMSVDVERRSCRIG